MIDEDLPVKIVTMNWDDYRKETEDLSSNYFGSITKKHRQFLIAQKQKEPVDFAQLFSTLSSHDLPADYYKKP